MKVMPASANDLDLTPLCRRRYLCEEGCHVRVIKVAMVSNDGAAVNLPSEKVGVVKCPAGIGECRRCRFDAGNLLG